MSKLLAPPPLNLEPQSLNLETKITPTILLIIIILAIIFFVSGLVHLLIRCITRPVQRDPDEVDNVTAFEGQLQHLFHLHDSGVDQLYIDTLPVFAYKAIIGVKDPFDCAVCLCEFEPNDKLRLLPKCSHAFHMDCIDTWLLSHSTCPLCRSSLLSDYYDGGVGCRNPVPFVCVLESGSVEHSREIQEMGLENDLSEFRSSRVELNIKGEEEKIMTVKLGKFRNVDEGVGCSNEDDKHDDSKGNDGNLDSRRCYSMGSFAYVLDEKTALQVPVKSVMKKQKSKKPGHRAAMSEYGYDSMREFNGIEAYRSLEVLMNQAKGKGNENAFLNSNERGKSESFSVSKIWNNKKGNGSSSMRTNSGIEVEEGELRGDDETQSCYSVDSLVANPASYRRTLQWLMGRQNKNCHNHSSSMSSNV